MIFSVYDLLPGLRERQEDGNQDRVIVMSVFVVGLEIACYITAHLRFSNRKRHAPLMQTSPSGTKIAKAVRLSLFSPYCHSICPLRDTKASDSRPLEVCRQRSSISISNRTPKLRAGDRTVLTFGHSLMM